MVCWLAGTGAEFSGCLIWALVCLVVYLFMDLVVLGSSRVDVVIDGLGWFFGLGSVVLVGFQGWCNFGALHGCLVGVLIWYWLDFDFIVLLWFVALLFRFRWVLGTGCFGF